MSSTHSDRSVLGDEYIRKDLAKHGAASNLQFNEHIKSLQREGKRIYHLGFGQSPFPIPTFAQETLKKYAHVGSYLHIRGLFELREAICQFHKNEDDLHHFSVDDIIVGPGSKELIFLVQMVTTGDILLLAPTWTTYMPQALLSHHNVIKIPTCYQQQWKLTPQLFEDICKNNSVKAGSILILCNPDNPKSQLSKQLGETKFCFEMSISKTSLSWSNEFYPEGTILSCGISKWASCGGWRLGYHMYPPELRALGEMVSSAASQTYTSASAPIQHAAVETKTDGSCTFSNLIKLRHVGVKVLTPASGYYIFPDFEVIRNELAERGILSGVQMCSVILEDTNVAIMAGGPAFLHGEQDLTVRLCYVNFDGSLAIKGSEKVGLDESLPESFLGEYCFPTVDAINLLSSWVEKMKHKTN